MRLKSLELQNFRAFSELSLDLSADLTVVFGRNGSGKTALFDAIELCLTGRSRFDDVTREITHLRRAYTASGEPVELALDLVRDDSVLEIRCSLDEEQGFLFRGPGGAREPREFLYNDFVNPDYFPPRREVLPVHSALRATVLLTQDSIDVFSGGEPSARARILATLSGAAYVERCRAKAELVEKEGKKRLRGVASRQEVQREELRQVEHELAEVAGKVTQLEEEAGASAPGLEAAFEAATNCGLEVGFLAGAEDSGPEEAAELAGRVSALRDSWGLRAQDRRDALAGIEAGWERAARERSRRSQMEHDLRAAEARLSEAREAERQLAEELELARVEIATLVSRARELQRCADAHEVISRLTPELTALENRFREREATVGSLRTRIAEARERKGESEAQRASAAVAATSARAAVAAPELRLELLEPLLLDLDGYVAAGEHAVAAGVEVARAQSERENISTQSVAAREAIDSWMATLRETSAALVLARENGAQQENLAAQLAAMVSGETCPACGAEHGSPAAVRDALEAHLGAASAEVTRVEQLREEAEIALRAAQDELGRLSERDRELIGEIETKGIEVAGSASVRSGMESRAAEAGCTLDRRALENSAAEERRRLNEARETLAPSERALQEAERELTLAVAAEEELLSSLESGLASRDAMAEAVEAADSELAAARSVLETSGEARVGAESLPAERDACRAEQAAKEVARQRLEARASETTQSVTRYKAEVSELSGKVEELAGSIARFTQKLAVAGLAESPTGEEITDAVAALDREEAALIALEQALRVLASAKRLSVLRESKAELETARGSLRAQESEYQDSASGLGRIIEQASSWRSSLSEYVTNRIKSALNQHHLAIERHFKALIPSPHLFGRIRLEYDDAGLAVGFSYRGLDEKVLEPGLYFSKAQGNVLAIAMFLSLATRQKWTHLQTLLLDDPVQHLDDLDAVAFIDTIRATALGRFGSGKQIIVSTCDENLYRLMLRKYSMVRDITFNAVRLRDRGIEGPELIYDARTDAETQPSWLAGQ